MIWTRLPASALSTQPDLRRDWDRLNAARLDLPFLSADAVVAALDAFGNDGACLFVCQAGEQAVAMFLLVPEGALRWRTFQPSQLPLGAWVAARDAELPALCRSLMRSRLRLCLALSVTQVDPLHTPQPADAPDTECSAYIDTAWIDIEGDFDTYWAARGKNLRQNLKKQRNRLATEGTATELRVWRQPQDMAPALTRYGALESAGWKGREGTAIHPDNAQGRFYTRLFEEAARRGEARVFEYLLGERVAAIDLCLLRQGVLVMLKTAYDEAMPKTLSPALLLHEAELQRMFADGEVRRVEFYGRVMDWHTRFTEHRRGLYHLTAYRWPAVKALALRRRAAAQARAPATAEPVASDAEGN